MIQCHVMFADPVRAEAPDVRPRAPTQTATAPWTLRTRAQRTPARRSPESAGAGTARWTATSMVPVVGLLVFGHRQRVGARVQGAQETA
eukprot:8593529-Alexandrium_andersonii.AAC.1